MRNVLQDGDNSKDLIMKKLNFLLNTTALRKLLSWNAEDRYRPEKYYMRGPGPKAKAKDCDIPRKDRSYAPGPGRVR